MYSMSCQVQMSNAKFRFFAVNLFDTISLNCKQNIQKLIENCNSISNVQFLKLKYLEKIKAQRILGNFTLDLFYCFIWI